MSKSEYISKTFLKSIPQRIRFFIKTFPYQLRTKQHKIRWKYIDALFSQTTTKTRIRLLLTHVGPITKEQIVTIIHPTSNVKPKTIIRQIYRLIERDEAYEQDELIKLTDNFPSVIMKENISNDFPKIILREDKEFIPYWKWGLSFGLSLAAIINGSYFSNPPLLVTGLGFLFYSILRNLKEYLDVTPY